MQQVTRRSSRLKRKIQVPEATTPVQLIQDKDEELETPDVSDVEDEEEERKTTRKKRKTNPKAKAPDAASLNEMPGANKQEPSPFRNVRGRRGFLQYMNDMPLDILYEIFGELEPVDLLYLSWSCKSVRAIVMDRQAKFLWEKAYKALKDPPPPCPSDLNYAQYTRFLFVNRCMVCQVAAASSAQYYSWGLRFKACKRCLKTTHFTTYVSSGEIATYHHHIRPGGKIRYYLKFVEELAHSYVENPQSINVQDFSDDYQRKERGEGDYKKWRRNLNLNRNEVLSQKREARRGAILQKLDEIGWSTEMVVKYAEHTEFGVNNLPTFGRSSKLTQGEWIKICPEILPILEEGKLNWQRERILKNGQQFRATFKQWYNVQFQRLELDVDFQAVPFDFMIHEPFMSSILNYNEEATFPLDEETASTFMVLHTESLRKRNQILFDLLPEDMKQQAKAMNDLYQVLRLASAWFSRDNLLTDYSAIISNIKIPYLESDDTCEIMKYREHFDNTIDNLNLSFSYKAHNLANYLIKASGNDPNITMTTMARDVQSSVVKIHCIRCTHHPNTNDWFRVIHHGYQHARPIMDESQLSWDGMFSIETKPEAKLLPIV